MARNADSELLPSFGRACVRCCTVCGTRRRWRNGGAVLGVVCAVLEAREVFFPHLKFPEHLDLWGRGNPGSSSCFPPT